MSILENPKQIFDHVLRDGNAVKGFMGVVDGETVAYMVYKTGSNQGQIATSIVPSVQQAANRGLKL
ncbi:hypothetical protein JHU04_004267 [Brenneria sp. 4F2]|nr:hypothetical protein [Brenneria bubanii]